MQTEIIFPLNWTAWDKQDELVNTYYDVTFTDDYGVFKKDEKFSSVTIDYAKGFIKAYSSDGLTVEKIQNFKTIAIS